MREPRLDGVERGKVELHTLDLAVMLEGFHALRRLGRQVHELPVGIAGEPGIVLLKVPQDRDDKLLAEILGEVHLPLAFLGIERIRRGQQDDRLAGGVGLAERIAPALARADAV